MFGIARISRVWQRIIPAIADNLELVRVKFVLFHDRFADRIGAVVGKLPDEIRRDDSFAAGVSVALDNDVSIAESARELADFLERRRDSRVVGGIEHRFIWL